MANEIRIVYTLIEPIINDGVSACQFEDKEIIILDLAGTSSDYYTYFLNTSSTVQYDCIVAGNTRVAGYPDDNAVIYRNGTVPIWQISQYHVGFNFYIEYEVVPEMSPYTYEIEGEGGVDIEAISGYTENDFGGWFATIDVHTFNESLITANFLANPNRYALGELALEYHGFTAETMQLNRRKLFIDVHQWFKTLEPGGDVQEVSVWVPVPFYPRASSIKWGLMPSVKGTLRIWTCKLIVGIDAYF